MSLHRQNSCTHLLSRSTYHIRQKTDHLFRYFLPISEMARKRKREEEEEREREREREREITGVNGVCVQCARAGDDRKGNGDD